MEFMQIKLTADKATDAWLSNDSAENFAAMKAADAALTAAKAAGLNIIKINDTALAGIMERSVFGTVDRIRAARAA